MPAVADLARRANALASAHDWDVLGTLSHDEREFRMLVRPPGAPVPAELCVRAPADGATHRTEVEIGVSDRVRSEHVLRVVEVLSEPASRRERRDGALPPPLLREHASGGLLADLLARRTYLRAGEAATVLLGTAHGLAALNEAGWSHGAVTIRSIAFRDDACPAIIGLASARPLQPETAGSDRRGFQRLAERLASSIPRAEGDRLLEAVRGSLDAGSWTDVCDAIAVAIEPEAVFISREDAAPHEDAPARTRSRRRRIESSLPGQRAPTQAMPPSLLNGVLDGHPLADLSHMARGWLSRRRRILLIAAVPLALAVAVVAIVPPRGPAGQPTTTSPTGSAHSGSADSGAAAGSSAAGTPGSEPPSSTPSASSPRGAAGRGPAVSADDPVAAAGALLASRHSCFVKASPAASCLESSVAMDSALFRADAEALGHGDGSAQDFSGARFSLVQRWGDVALVSAERPALAGEDREPASLLLIRNEAGWRLRDVYVD